jgi:hypothetical protein
MPLSGKGEAAAEGADHTKLPYRIELWQGDTFERVLALAAHVGLARVIYSAAKSEYPERIIVLSHGARVIARTTDE